MPLICVTSPKGGVGKTTLAAAVARELARLERRVIAIDLDPQNALGLHLGLDLRDDAGFAAALPDAADPLLLWNGALRSTGAGLRVLPHGRVDRHETLVLYAALLNDPLRLIAPIRDALSDPRLIIVADLPPGTSPELAAILPVTDFLMAVLLADTASLIQLEAIESGLIYGPNGAPGLPGQRVGFVLNQYDTRSRLGRAAGEAAVRHLGDRLLGLVYRDEHVREALAAQQVVGDYAPASRAAADIRAIAHTLLHRLETHGREAGQ